MKGALRSVILLCAAAGAILTLTFAVLTLSPSASAAGTESNESYGYFLKLEDNEIVIYKNGEPSYTGIVVSGLRDSDRALLESGISANSYEEILKLVEDFSS